MLPACLDRRWSPDDQRAYYSVSSAARLAAERWRAVPMGAVAAKARTPNPLPPQLEPLIR
jgi:hypothetical protein